MTFKFRLACAAALAVFATAAQASVTYQFNIDTSSLVGTSGFVELQLGSSNTLPFQDATATISHFQDGGGALANIDPYTSADLFGTPDVLGNVSGVLPGTLLLDDDGSAVVADYLHPITFGNSISFFVTLGGPAVDASDCAGFVFGACAVHGFGVGILDAGENYALVADPDSAFLLGGLDVSGNGTVTSYFNPAPDGEASALAIAMPIPEPAAWTLMLAGLGGLAMAVRRRDKRRRIGHAAT